MAEQPVVVVAPYLPIKKPVEIGPWTLEPASEAVRSRRIRNDIPLKKLLQAYNCFGNRCGAVGRLGRTWIGAPIPNRGWVDQLGGALLYGVLSARLLLSDDDAPKGTADNAFVGGHPLGDPSFTVIPTGGIFTTSRGIPLDGKVGTITPPQDLFIPASLPELDQEVMAAFYEELGQVGKKIVARRIRRALQWLRFAWTNTIAITEDARIVALRTAFEALLTKRTFKPNESWKVREHFSGLVARGEPKTPRGPKKREMTDAAWWFENFTLLRNEIIHGDTAQKRSRVFGPDSEGQTFVATRNLLTALLEVLIREGHPKELREHQIHRDMLRILTPA